MIVRLTIDDQSIEVPSGYTLLQAAREHGIHIPTLCYLESLAPYAVCRAMENRSCGMLVSVQ
jgi:NADH dehydrogenase/NADH:ubiquinone oxidoreductase subunit G